MPQLGKPFQQDTYTHTRLLAMSSISHHTLPADISGSPMRTNSILARHEPKPSASAGEAADGENLNQQSAAGPKPSQMQ